MIPKADKKRAKKAQIIADLSAARKNILAAAASIPPELQEEVFLGIWSVKDLLAHLVGWDFTNIQAVGEILEAKLPSFYNYHDRDWKSYNAQLVAEYRKDNYNDLLQSVASSHKSLLDYLERVPAEAFEADRGIRFKGYKVTIARTLQAEIKDEITHHEQIQAFLGKKEA